MKDHITVIPEDNVIIVDKLPLFFDLPQNTNIHAIQWHEGKGHIEWKDGTPNTELAGEAQYKQHIQTWEDLWNDEKNRVYQESIRPRTLKEARESRINDIKWRLNEIDFQLMRSLAEMFNNTAIDEDRAMFTALMNEKHELQAELTTLTASTE